MVPTKEFKGWTIRFRHIQWKSLCSVCYWDGVNPNALGESRSKLRLRTTEQSLQEVNTLVYEDASGNKKVYLIGKVLGNGSFGVVWEATESGTDVTVAIKRVLQDPKYKNRELGIMTQLDHPNVVMLKDFFFTDVFLEDQKEEHQRYLNVVMEHIPDTVFKVMRSFLRYNRSMPMLLVKLYTYQLCRALGYLHSLEICHRDVKPQNLLVNSKSHVLKLCDFGSAKRLGKGERSVAYICSRFYRAPELILGSEEYTTAIDTWSIGCVMGEMLLGKPLFSGESSVEQMVKIVQILGTPTEPQFASLCPSFSGYKFPDVKSRELKLVFGSNIPDSAISLLKQFLVYEPEGRVKPLELRCFISQALGHEFFDELRDSSTRLACGGKLPDLASFSDKELQGMSEQTLKKLFSNKKR
ncbi:putative cell-cycle-associated protein kinase GSK [Cardiosporidium cionae]|uniref:Cell-cycle-associated protein kinase GSK n=1 Tax=Cardiosporidium cionae TaxID=476202 RepID=A0ABQ7JGJ1_9APIC|nr:putative cell-cycle-associated protein kinase GSK [Cardiosporidium cionae]|eukprot:KAF8823107.1 putative cell-cycle-associated protein kinase GSK [Cardiosporidium cionae]